MTSSAAAKHRARPRKIVAIQDFDALKTKNSSSSKLLFPPAAAASAPAAAAPPSVQKTAPGWENTMAVKDGETSKLRPKTA